MAINVYCTDSCLEVFFKFQVSHACQKMAVTKRLICLMLYYRLVFGFFQISFSIKCAIVAGTLSDSIAWFKP